MTDPLRSPAAREPKRKLQKKQPFSHVMPLVVARHVGRGGSYHRQEVEVHQLRDDAEGDCRRPKVLPHRPANRPEYFVRDLVRLHSEPLEKLESVDSLLVLIEVGVDGRRVEDQHVDASRLDLACKRRAECGDEALCGGVQDAERAGHGARGGGGEDDAALHFFGHLEVALAENQKHRGR